MTNANQQNDFQARLARINGGETEVAEGLVQPKREIREDVRLNGSLLENAKYPASIVGAFILGLCTVVFGRFVRLHVLGTPDPEGDPMFSAMMDGGMALAIGFALKELFRLEGHEWVTAQTAGITVMVGAMHNLVHMNPELWTTLFNAEWVEFTMQYTEFRTLQFGGYILPF